MSMYDAWARSRLDEHTRWLLQIGTGVSTPCPSEAHAEALNKRLHNEWVAAQRPAGVFHRNNYTGWWSEEVFNRLEAKAVVTYDKTLGGKLYKRLYILKSDRFVDGIQITWVAYPDGEAAWHKARSADCFHYNF